MLNSSCITISVLISNLSCGLVNRLLGRTYCFRSTAGNLSWFNSWASSRYSTWLKCFFFLNLNKIIRRLLIMRIWLSVTGTDGTYVYTIEPNADLRDVNLYRAELSRTNLNSADLSGAVWNGEIVFPEGFEIPEGSQA
jgi:hypothetical protein